MHLIIHSFFALASYLALLLVRGYCRQRRVKSFQNFSFSDGWWQISACDSGSVQCVQLPVELPICFWAVFLLSVIPRWLPLPPRVWSLATSFSCSTSPKLACLEPGVSPRVDVCAHTRAHASVCLLGNCLLPAWLVRGGTGSAPPCWPQQGSHEWLACVSEPLLPWRKM